MISASCDCNRIDINVSERTYQHIMYNLLGAHGLTGSDTVAKYCGIRKITMWKAMC